MNQISPVESTTFVNSDSDVIRHIPFSSIDDVFNSVVNRSRGRRVFDIVVVLERRSSVKLDFARCILHNFGVSIKGVHFLFICIGYGE